MSFKTQVSVLALVALLTGCGDREVILQGERLDVRTPLPAAADAAEGEGVEAIAAAAIDEAEAGKVDAGVNPVPVSLPGQVSNAEWTHRGGSPAHFAGHLAAGAGTTRVWSASVGAGSTRKARLTAEPVVGGGRIYTLDASSGLVATSTGGGTVWQADLTPAGEKAGGGAGSGLAFAGGQVFATTGFGELVAVDAASGAVQWRQRFDNGAAGAPTASGGVVYAGTRDGTAMALRASDGKILWQVEGAASRDGIGGGSSPALNGPQVVFPSATGQLLSIDSQTGQPVWQAHVSGARLGRASATVSDLTGDPVVAGGVIYAGNLAGRLGAVFAESGQPVWSTGEGAGGPVQVAGGQLYLVNDENQLVRLDATTGDVVWRIDLPFFTKDRDKRRKGIFVHFGPVLAGGRLWTASTDGYLRAFDPASGAVVAATEVPGGAASAPVVAGGTIYVLSQNGQLHAFR
ncbi:MAG: hypothetical protein RLZZ528_2234 [Pseudomonadota bacterium]